MPPPSTQQITKACPQPVCGLPVCGHGHPLSTQHSQGTTLFPCAHALCAGEDFDLYRASPRSSQRPSTAHTYATSDKPSDDGGSWTGGEWSDSDFERDPVWADPFDHMTVEWCFPHMWCFDHMTVEWCFWNLPSVPCAPSAGAAVLLHALPLGLHWPPPPRAALAPSP